MDNLTKKQQSQEKSYIFPYHYLDLQCDNYKFLHYVEYLNLLKLIINIPDKIQKETSILDAGCGDGRLCFELSKKYPEINNCGVDYSDRAIAFAKAFNPHGEFYVNDLAKMRLNKKFDYIFLIETLEHIPPENIPAILQNLSGHLSLTGKIIITVPSRNLPLETKHYQHFTKESLTRTISDHFKIMEIKYHSAKNIHRKIFSVLRRFGLLIYPFKDKIFPVNKFYGFLNNYYSKKISPAGSEDGFGLIAVCEKNKS